MECANCRQDKPPAYTLRTHVDSEEAADTRADGGDAVTVDLSFCSIECLQTWT
jgi:hypothetical protein